MNIKADFSDYDEIDFLAAMLDCGWMHPFNERGEKVEIASLPGTVAGMPYDPHQSLAAFLRMTGVFEIPANSTQNLHGLTTCAGVSPEIQKPLKGLQKCSHGLTALRVRGKPDCCRDISTKTGRASNPLSSEIKMPERFHLQLSGRDLPLLKLVADDTVLLSSGIGYNGVRYVVLSTIHRADADRWREMLASSSRPYRLERVNEAEESEDVEISGLPDWLS